MSLTLDSYRLLGRSGLRVSPLALGAATFGTEWGWGAERDEARKLFDLYTERGGNFIDTASTYTNGSSEHMLGEFTRDHRESLILATKYSTLRRPGDPNSGGSHRKNLFASVETSLRRLQTDYIDLLYLHVWDATTPVEEILRGLDDLVRQGKVLYVAISNAPAWQVARMQVIADLRGWSPLVALQIEYSLIERAGERDLIPMARELGLGVAPWSPLGGGVLTGKYSRDDLTAMHAAAADGTRKSVTVAGGTLTERNLAIVDVVKEVAAESGRTPAQVGLAWTLRNPGVTAPVIGARTPAQLEDNLGALEVDLTAAQLARLDEASAIELGFPHAMLAGDVARTLIHGDLRVQRRR
ncbi:aldo/keto reductase [Streptomyces flavofungini]|uniref:Aldo/keto reductase n=1 Tax=Streptomyces flavofungini TaxID=68200 RepID=A0ABS0X7Y9_9ACTN|nr:aldo/keto reductase [Streptomyces flavofungini]MBJ3809318.1 aldo/keto reductase [Streptomyces flavofungini]GHC77553.1 aldo/keto reductase [Streptomyces flavofungini]